MKKKDELFDIYKNAIAETNPTMTNEFLDFLFYTPTLICIAYNTETEEIAMESRSTTGTVRNSAARNIA